MSAFPAAASPSGARWECARCTFSNVGATLACEVCQAPRMRPVDAATPMRVSTSPVPVAPSSSVLRSISGGANYSAGQWSCTACSLHNAETSNRCSACKTARPGQGAPAAASSTSSAAPPAGTPSAVVTSHAPTLQSGQFQCQSCTFINDALTDACEVCGTARVKRSAAAMDTSGNAISSMSFMPNAAPAAASSSQQTAGTSWSCSVCSMLNSMDIVRCTVCRALSPMAAALEASATAAASAAAASHHSTSIPRSARGQVVPVTQQQQQQHLPPSRNGSGATIQSTMNPQMCPSSAAAAASSADAMLDPSGEREAAAQWQEIMAVCGSTSNQFTDDSFRPGDRSIYGPGGAAAFATRTIPQFDPSTGKIVGQGKWGPFGWKRARHATKQSAKAWCILPFDKEGRIDVKPSDIKQGELGDCWFVSALCVLAERPKLIEHLLLTPELNSVGAYQIRFCKSGAWRTVTVDDYLPVNAETGRLAFSHTPGNELWVALVEKAYAKLHGSYSAIEDGSICEAFSELTGAPSETLELHSEEMSKWAVAQSQKLSGGDPQLHRELLWATILSFRQSRFLMGASCGRRNADPSIYSAVGLLPDHAYALLDARMEGGVQLVQLRNPWGQHEWAGDWSRQSPLWTLQMRKALNYHPHPSSSGSSNTMFFQHFNPVTPTSEADASIGTFWMSFTDFLAYFRTIDVCKFQDEWHVVRLRDEFALTQPQMQMQQQYHQQRAMNIPAMFGQQMMQQQQQQLASQQPQQQQQVISANHFDWTSHYMYELSIPASTWCFVSIIQQDLRGTGAIKPYTYRSIGMFLLKSSSASSIDASPSTYQRCNEAFPETQRQISCETMMTDTKGRYLVVPCSYAATIAAANGNYGASANPASASFPFILCVYSAHPVLIKRRPAWIPALTIAKQLATIRGDSKPLGDHSTLYTFDCQGGLWFVVVNRHPTKYLSITVDCSRSVGLIPSRGPAGAIIKTQDCVPPRHRQLVLALVTPVAFDGYSYERTCSFVHIDGVSGMLHQPPLRRGYDIHQPIPIDHATVPQIV